VDIILRSKGDSGGGYRKVAASEARPSTGRQEFTWDQPSAVFSQEEQASEEMFQDQLFYLELYDAVGGGLICR